jgi:hypothetical protein
LSENVERLLREMEGRAAQEACELLMRQAIRMEDGELLKKLKKFIWEQRRSWRDLRIKVDDINFGDLTKAWAEKYGIVEVPGKGKTHLMDPHMGGGRTVCGLRVTPEFLFFKEEAGHNLCQRCGRGKRKTWYNLGNSNSYLLQQATIACWTKIVGYLPYQGTTHLASAGEGMTTRHFPEGFGTESSRHRTSCKTLCGETLETSFIKGDPRSYNYGAACPECAKKATPTKLSNFCKKKRDKKS